MSWEQEPDAASPSKADVDYMQLCMEQLYELDHAELRRLAWEALLIADGPDRVRDLPCRDTIFLVMTHHNEYNVGFEILSTHDQGGWTV